MSTDSERFADAVVQFVRGFGLHRPERTPCGFDASVVEAHALGELAEGPLRQMELVERLGLTKSAVSHLVSGMVDRGWTEREGVSGDGRGVTLRLTRGGPTPSRCSGCWRRLPVPATPASPEVGIPTRRRGRWLVIAAALVGAATVGLGVGIAVAGDGDPPSRQEVVAEHGARVMPFDLEATTHVFAPDVDGGIQTVDVG